MSRRVCVLAAWEVHEYHAAEKRERGRSIVDGELPGSRNSSLRWLTCGPARHLRIEYATDYRLDCRNHKHIPHAKAVEMVSGAGGYKHFDVRLQEYVNQPVAEWVGPGERRITALRQQTVRVRSLSVQAGFDAAGNAIPNEGRPETGDERRARNARGEHAPLMNIEAEKAAATENRGADWLESMLAQL